MSNERRERLMKLAQAILDDMEDHQLFGFILTNAGSKAVPEIVKIWGETSERKREEKGKGLVEIVLE